MKATFIVCLVFLWATVALSAKIPKKNLIERPVFRQRSSPKVIGGAEVVPHSVPFQVALFLDGYFCGGSLINEKWVLTAGHCGVLTDAPQVVLGAHNVREDEPTQVIVNGLPPIVHENYDEEDNIRNDIALIELPQAVTLNENIQTVKLAPSDIGDLVGETAQVSGWGLTHDTDTSISPVLNAVNSTLLTNAECQSEFGSGIRVFDTVVCLDGRDLKSSCNGDSGGPLVIRRDGEIIEVGLTSYGIIYGCEVGYPSAFTRISSYIDWVEGKTGIKF